MTTYIMSTTMIPAGAWGRWELDSIDRDQAALMVYPEGTGYVSAVGHQSTAEVLSDLLGVHIRANRITVEPVPGDRFLCFKLNARPPEGAILDREALESLGYQFALMRYIG